MRLPEQVILERDATMWELKKRGLTYEKIGKAMNVSAKTAHAGVKRMEEKVLARLAQDHAGQVALDLERLDDMLAGFLPMALPRKIDGPDGDKIDIPPSPEAADRVLKIMDRRGKLLGLDNVTIDLNVKPALGSGAAGESAAEAIERSVKEETIALLKIMHQNGVYDSKVVGEMIRTLNNEQPDVVDAEVVEEEQLAIEAPTSDGPPEFFEEDDSKVWDE